MANHLVGQQKDLRKLIFLGTSLVILWKERNHCVLVNTCQQQMRTNQIMVFANSVEKAFIFIRLRSTDTSSEATYRNRTLVRHPHSSGSGMRSTLKSKVWYFFSTFLVRTLRGHSKKFSGHLPYMLGVLNKIVDTFLLECKVSRANLRDLHSRFTS